MKSVLPLLSFALVLASCSTAYRTGQTPDDVYFSPQQPQNEYARVENRKEENRYDKRYEAEDDDDRYLRMKVRNRRVWSDLDYYYSDPFAYNYHVFVYRNTYNTSWNPYNTWNYYYNPYYNNYNNYVILNPKTSTVNTPRRYNMQVFEAPTNGTYNSKTGNNQRVYNSNSPANTYNNNNAPRRSSGSDMRAIFNNGNSSNSSSNNSSTPARTESSNSSRPSTSSGSTSAPVRKFD